MIDRLFTESVTGMRKEIIHEINHYAILISSDQATMRLGWVSPSTGLTYCGICLRSPVTPKIGADCHACGARVARTFELYADAYTTKRAWKEASLTSGGMKLRRTGTL